MNRLIIIDGHAILHRAYHALPVTLTTSKGEIINAAFGFTSMVIRVINDLKPTHFVVCFDRPTPTFRNELFADYQSQRPKMDNELIGQIDLVHKVIAEMGIQIFEMDGYEADDLIGTIVQKLKTQNSKLNSSTRSGLTLNKVECVKTTGQNSKVEDNFETIIVTGDKDILQLVDENTKVYLPVKGLSESKMYGEKEVKEKYGIKPSQIVDYKALVGDPSDNYPGVPGIGPKSAARLVIEFGTLEDIYSKINFVRNEKVRKLLLDNQESARMCKKLAQIVKDAPIEIDPDKVKLGNMLKPNIVRLFEELEFRSLIPRLGGNIKKHKTDNNEHLTNKINKKDCSSQISLF
jgi:DNA polymerase I